MEIDIALYATSYVALRMAILAAIAYAFYRILRRKSSPVAIMYAFYRILRRKSSPVAIIETNPADTDSENFVRNDRR
jgi:hypothetical protein